MDKDKKIAILIDAENISNKYINLVLDEVNDFGSATYKRLYGDYESPSVRAWLKELQDYAITPVFQNNYTKGKNASDSALIIDAMDILYSGNVDGFCIVSSDSDFTKLAMRLRESGMTVLGMGERKTPNSFVSACETFKFLDLLYKEDEKVSGGVMEQEESSIPSRKEIEKIIISIIEAKASDDGWMDLSEIANNLFKRVSGFDPRNYGCIKLKKLIESFDSLKTKWVDHPNNNMNRTIYVSLK